MQLNIYTARLASSTPGSTVLGYAYCPWDVQSNVVHDGVFINDRTLPGGTATAGSIVYNKGIVTVHEVRALHQHQHEHQPRWRLLPRLNALLQSASQ